MLREITTHDDMEIDYNTGVQIVNSTLSEDLVLSESTGSFNAVLSVNQWNIFWQNIIQSDCVF